MCSGGPKEARSTLSACLRQSILRIFPFWSGFDRTHMAGFLPVMERTKSSRHSWAISFRSFPSRREAHFCFTSTFSAWKKNDVKSGWLVTSMSCSWEWKAYLNSHIFGGVKFLAPCSLLWLWALKIVRQTIFDLIMRKGFCLIDNTVLTTTALNASSDIFQILEFPNTV